MNPMQNNRGGFDDAFLQLEPYGKIGMVTNFPNLDTLAPGIIVQTLARIGGLLWRGTDVNGNFNNTGFQGYKNGYSYTIANILGLVVTSNSVMAGTGATAADAFNTTLENSNTIGAGQAAPTISESTIVGQRILLPVTPGVSGQQLVAGMGLYQKVPTAGMDWKDTVKYYAFPLGRPSDNTYVYSGYSIYNSNSQSSDVFIATFGKLIECIVKTYPNLTNNIS